MKVLANKEIKEKHKVEIVTIGNDALVNRARQEITKIAMDANVDKLLFVDADIIFEVSDFLKIVDADKEVIGGTYRKKCAEPVLNFNIMEEEIHCNPAGDWEIGSFEADAGVTGRKLVVDNYGPRVPIGGGAFSGKDVTKVDRSAAYMARRIALDYLHEYNAKEAKIELSYAIGCAQPIQATAILNYGRGWEKNIMEIVEYDLSPQGIIDYLDLKNINFSETAKWGHMGANFNWG